MGSTVNTHGGSGVGRHGRLITLEGLEGVGKTTNREFVVDCLRASGLGVIVTREPGGTELGETLRQLVLHGGTGMQATTELLLIVAARVEHLHQVVEPALAAGQWVVCDRFIDASHAYQGAGRGLGSELVGQLHVLAGINREPDLTLLLDMPPAVGLARMQARSEPDRIEREAEAFFDRARETYVARAAAEPERMTLIDASQSLPAVQSAIREALSALLDPLGAVSTAGTEAGSAPTSGAGVESGSAEQSTEPR